MNSNQFFICVMSCAILTACANPQTGGIGLNAGPPKPSPQQDLAELSKNVVDVYSSLSYLPEQGFEKKSEYSRTVEMSSGTECSYKVTEMMTLIETDPEVITQFKYDQALDPESSKFCPAKDSFLVDTTTTQKFREYANDRIDQFYKFSDIKIFLDRYSWVKTAEVATMQTVDFKGESALRVRLKILGKDNQTYYLQTIFSKDNSFLALLDQQLTRVADSKVISYRRWIDQ
jgi:hypothetical protein